MGQNPSLNIERASGRSTIACIIVTRRVSNCICRFHIDPIFYFRLKQGRKDQVQVFLRTQAVKRSPLFSSDIGGEMEIFSPPVASH